jgi:hypothetical protein
MNMDEFPKFWNILLQYVWEKKSESFFYAKMSIYDKIIKSPGAWDRPSGMPVIREVE